jgi:ribokinase
MVAGGSASPIDPVPSEHRVRVAVVGHIEWVEFVTLEQLPHAGEVAHSTHSFTRAAGGGGVVAVVLSELGAQVDFFTALGRDADGKAAAAQLADRGVTAHIAWRDRPTRRAFTLIDKQHERTIVTLGERLEPSGADPLPWERLDGADGAFFTAGDRATLEYARRARILVASPRARGALAQDPPTIDALVYSSRDEREREWAARPAAYARLIVKTAGGRGGTWDGESTGSWKAAPPPGPIRDSYGCGDSFAAAFTFGLARGLTVAQAVALGAQAGARCLTRDGAP